MATVERSSPLADASRAGDAFWDSLESQLDGIERESIFAEPVGAGQAFGSFPSIRVRPISGNAVSQYASSERRAPLAEPFGSDREWDSLESQLDGIETEALFIGAVVLSTATLAVDLDDTTLAATAVVVTPGPEALAALSASLIGSTVVARASALASAGLSRALSGSSLVSRAKAPEIASLTQGLAGSTLSATGKSTMRARVSTTLGAMTASGSAVVSGPVAGLSATLGEMTLGGVGRTEASAALSVTLDDTTLKSKDFTEGALSATLDEMSVVLVGFNPVVAALSVTMDGCVLDAVSDRSYSLEQIGICDIPTPGWFYGVRARTGAEYEYRR